MVNTPFFISPAYSVPRPSVGRETAGVVDHGIGVAELRQLLLRGPDQHRVHEQRVVGPRADHADLQAVLRIPAGEGVDAVEDFAGVEVVLRPLEVDQEAVVVDRQVHAAPPDVLLRGGVPHDPLVLRGAARLLAGVGDEGAGVGDGAAGVDAEGLGIEFGRGEVAADVGDGDAVGGEVDAAHAVGSGGGRVRAAIVSGSVPGGGSARLTKK
jgi:hypothetical protein